jgi:septal ring factor EnvC (AmiA/AmiB activator)
MSFSRRPNRLRSLVAALACALGVIALAAVPVDSSADPSLGQLNSQLGQEQSHQQSLSASIGNLSHLISSLDSQIALVQSREAEVRAELASDEAKLAATHAALVKEKKLLVLLKARLARAQMLLARQVVSSYEGDHPDIIAVVLEARGFSDLLDRLNYLRDAEQQQQSIITITRTAKARANDAAHRLAKLEATDRTITDETAIHARALAGMDSLLSGKQAALQKAKAAQQAALAASQARGAQLQSEIAKVQAQQAAAQAAANSAGNSSSSSGSGPGVGPALGPSGGWAIPYAIVLCESGGQNLPPNSAGASGYYQIIPSTWAAFGGTGPAAYLAPKSEQDAVATRIWNGGAGASNWVCAGIVGIH